MTHRTGLTLLEVLIAMAIGIAVVILITSFALDIADFGLFLNARLEDQRPLEQAIRVFTTEVRSMGPSENGSYPIGTAQESAFTFYADIDGDSDFEQVRYFVNGTTLQKGITEPSGTPATYPTGNEVVRDIVGHVASTSIFTYWPQGWVGGTAPLADPIETSSVRLVRMQVTVDANPTELPGPVTQVIYVTIRNLRGEI